MAITPRRIPARFSRRPTALSRAVARAFSREFHGRGALLRRARRAGAGALKKLRALRIVVAAAIVLAVLGLIVFLISSSTFRLSRIRVHREDPRTDVQEIQQVLRPLFGQHFLLLSFAAVEHMVREAFPEVSSVDLGIDYPGTLTVALRMDPVVMRVVVRGPEERSDQRSAVSGQGSGATNAVLTSRGVLLLYPFPTEESLKELQIVDWGTRPVHRDRILEESDLSTMQRAHAALEWEFGHQIRSTVLYLRAREFHVVALRPIQQVQGRPEEFEGRQAQGHPEQSRGVTERLSLWLDFASPLDDQLRRYRVFLRSVPPQDVSEYVDLRLKDRVVYK